MQVVMRDSEVEGEVRICFHALFMFRRASDWLGSGMAEESRATQKSRRSTRRWAAYLLKNGFLDYLLLRYIHAFVLSGFRFVIEALSGGTFADDIAPECVFASSDEPGMEGAASELSSDLRRYESMLHSRQPIIVGHNLLHDLCFIYQAFIGPMPPTADDFCVEIHRLFPRIVDTKHLSSRGDHSMTGDDSLAELFAETRPQHFPLLTPEDGGFCRVTEVAHQAGYDSESRVSFSFHPICVLTFAPRFSLIQTKAP